MKIYSKVQFIPRAGKLLLYYHFWCSLTVVTFTLTFTLFMQWFDRWERFQECNRTKTNIIIWPAGLLYTEFRYRNLMRTSAIRLSFIYNITVFSVNPFPCIRVVFLNDILGDGLTILSPLIPFQVHAVFTWAAGHYASRLTRRPCNTALQYYRHCNEQTCCTRR